jgi:DNA-binding transcriptional regulator YdaS (Cro superfamily)
MDQVIDRLGGSSAVARIVGVKSPSVTEWRRRGIPADRCPALERASEGKVTCEEMRPDVVWHRVPDAEWPHPQGRPLIDVAAATPARPKADNVIDPAAGTGANTEETQHAA